MFSGAGPNRTQALVIKQSNLIEIFRESRKHLITETMQNRTSRHSRPDMTKTRAKLANHIQNKRVNEYVPGRKAGYVIPNLFETGLSILHLLETEGIEYLADPSAPDDGEVADIDQDDLDAV